jgi:hypothetical protein
MQAALSSQIRAHIDRLARGVSGAEVEAVARQFNALPLYAGWVGWGLITADGEVLESNEAGFVSVAVDPLRTMYLVQGSETYPELVALLPTRQASSIDCPLCNASGWVLPPNGTLAGVRCAECCSLGWVEVPSNTSLERTRER